jgi:hypothetical protein
MTERGPSLRAGRLSEAEFRAFGGRSDYTGVTSEKRAGARYRLEEPVILETDRGELIGAMVINYGQRGLYFESDYRAEKGSVVIIRNESALSFPCQGGCEAQVRWTRRIDRKNSEYNYGTGVQYC